jgi:hypothetical protein
MTPLKICKNCEYAEAVEAILDNEFDDLLCSHPTSKDVIFGKQLSCRVVRSGPAPLKFHDSCGPTGKYYEERT